MKSIVVGLAPWRALTLSVSRILQRRISLRLKRERVRKRERYLAHRPPWVTAADADFSGERSALARLQNLATHVRDPIDSDDDR